MDAPGWDAVPPEARRWRPSPLRNGHTHTPEEAGETAEPLILTIYVRAATSELA